MLAMGERMDALQLVPDIASGQLNQQLQVSVCMLSTLFSNQRQHLRLPCWQQQVGHRSPCCTRCRACSCLAWPPAQ